MAVADGQCDDDEGAAALFKEEGVDYADDIDHSDTPILLRPLASAAESGNLDALRQAVDAFDGDTPLHHAVGDFGLMHKKKLKIVMGSFGVKRL
ncbi:hypothetical protein SASPL_118775 [Salvia splendens]|uniref:Uncharacterized protein n=1 Tax=Salvia splendens TaxID=180675 RepID=A0A8X8Y211_SALSN|nr:hypothetical protein SASPL_118775 [Salvia splendens]